jgi:predicted  nucleic acid-binding Zn-ribbon protein
MRVSSKDIEGKMPSARYHSCGCTNDIQDPRKKLERLEKDRVRYQLEILKMTDQIHLFTHEIEEIRRKL